MTAENQQQPQDQQQEAQPEQEPKKRIVQLSGTLRFRTGMDFGKAKPKEKGSK